MGTSELSQLNIPKRENLDSISYLSHKNLTVQVNVKDETIKLLENNSGEYFYNLGDKQKFS